MLITVQIIQKALRHVLINVSLCQCTSENMTVVHGMILYDAESHGLLVRKQSVSRKRNIIQASAFYDC